MKKVLLLIALFTTTGVFGQTAVDHYLGAQVGFADGISVAPEYEISFINNAKGYDQGFVAGAGYIFNFESKGDTYGAFVKAGYRLSRLSFGVLGGVRREDDTFEYDLVYENKALLGGWAGYNITNGTKLQVGFNNFSGFNVGFSFRLNRR